MASNTERVTELSEMITDFIAELRGSGNYPLADALEDALRDNGRCRFNCRTQREAFRAGWTAGAGHIEMDEEELYYCDEEYREWEKGGE